MLFAKWPGILVETGLVESKSEAKRLIKAGAVKIHNSKGITVMHPKTADGDVIFLEDRSVIQVGKRHMVRVVSNENRAN